ncbi:unnamed protein product [Malus baccata var. baccata]
MRSHFLVNEVCINAQGSSSPTLSIDQIDNTAEHWKRADILIDHNINPSKQVVFYRGYSSVHFDYIQLLNPFIFHVFVQGGNWDSGGVCNGEKEPVVSGAILDDYPLEMKIVEVLNMRIPVRLLNVTRLTNFRKDGHPSIFGKNATPGKNVSTVIQDCSHWCVPGVPDTWNELIYATFALQQTYSE